MKHTGMPAFRPTADCIRTSLKSSNKRHLILTGTRGTGKTTLLSQLFPQPMAGFTTWAEAQKGVYLKDNLSLRKAQIGVFDPSLPGTENKMVPSIDGLLTLYVTLLKEYLSSDSPWICLDEIGYLEAQYDFCQIGLHNLLNKKRVAAVIRKQDLPFLQELCHRDDVFLVDLDEPKRQTGCVIMASGLGRRFGENKLLADFHGKPLICNILKATEDIFTERIVITRHREIETLCKEQGVPVLFHDLPYKSDTIRLGIEQLSHMDACMFCPADQPLLTKETLLSLLLASSNEPNSIIRPAFEGRPGSPVIFPKCFFSELASLPQDEGGIYCIKKYPERQHLVSIRDQSQLSDVDTPKDLAKLIEE